MKIRVHTAIQTIDGVVQPGDYGYIRAEKYGTARNSKPEPGIAFARCTLSDKEVEYYISRGYLEYIEEDNMNNLPAVKTEDVLSIERLKGQVNLIQSVMREVMHDNEHYGVIPGCKKPSLLKPGAEKLSLTFRLAPYYEITEKEMPNLHREYVIKCTLKHIETLSVFGEGVGSCSTMEAKYRFRKSEQKCPKCGKETIIKGKQEYGGGWLCYQKKGGCGAKFNDGDKAIENQEMGRIEHDNPADYYNTVLKMAKKRAHVDAVLTATAASDIFTQDVEDMSDNGNGVHEQRPAKQTQPAPPRVQRANKDQLAKLEELYNGTYGKMDVNHFAFVITQHRKGEKLSLAEAQDLIDNWQARLDQLDAAEAAEGKANA